MARSREALAGDADLALEADDTTGLGVGHVVLADMHAVAIERHGEVGPVVHDEGHAALLAERPQGVGSARDGRIVHALQAQLEGRDIAAIQRRPEFVSENRRMIEAFRRDQVEAAAFGDRHALHLAL
jgi:hypothetical protein